MYPSEEPNASSHFTAIQALHALRRLAEQFFRVYGEGATWSGWGSSSHFPVRRRDLFGRSQRLTTKRA